MNTEKTEVEKQNMLEFLREHINYNGPYAPSISEVLSIKIKTDDDEHGAACDHYIVEYNLMCIDVTFTSPHINIKKKCLVEKNTYQIWKNKKNCVIFID